MIRVYIVKGETEVRARNDSDFCYPSTVIFTI